jgi:hypothetical protein
MEKSAQASIGNATHKSEAEFIASMIRLIFQRQAEVDDSA